MLRCSRIPPCSAASQELGARTRIKGQGEVPALGELAAIPSPASSQPRQKQKAQNGFRKCVSQNNANLH